MATRKFKYNEKLHKIAEEWIKVNGLMHFGGAPLGEYCKALGIHVTSHYNWLERFPQYAKMVDEAMEYYRQAHTKKLFNALLDSALGGYRSRRWSLRQFHPRSDYRLRRRSCGCTGSAIQILRSNHHC